VLTEEPSDSASEGKVENQHSGIFPDGLLTCFFLFVSNRLQFLHHFSFSIQDMGLPKQRLTKLLRTQRHKHTYDFTPTVLAGFETVIRYFYIYIGNEYTALFAVKWIFV